jgi:RND family efflux transporter MFP subunit
MRPRAWYSYRPGLRTRLVRRPFDSSCSGAIISDVGQTRRFLLFFVVLVVALGGGFLALRERATVPTATAPAATGSGGPAGVAIDHRRQQLIGVRTARVARGTLARTIRASGTVGYDETRLTDINLKLEGWIVDLYVNYVGQRVARGQALFTLYSPELLAVQNELLLGLRNRDQLTDSQASNAREFGERVVDVPRQRLLRWDVPADQVRALEDSRQIPAAVEFRSPADGVVIETAAVKGMHVGSGQRLYRLADLSVVWIEVDFHASDLSELRVGANADVTTDSWPGHRLSGTIRNIYPYMTEQTRTVKARVALPNRDGRLKPGMFVNVDVAVTPSEGLLIPADAVVDSGTRQIVFVAQGQGHFEPRDVTVGARSDGQALILAGLKEQEEVVVRATFFLDSESQMRSALQDYQTASPQASGSAKPARFDLNVQTTPNPPRAGENVVEVHVRDTEAGPVTDAEVRVLFYMAPMPSMNMPAMRSEARLAHVDNGVYRGPADISMSGRWDMTVTALRQGQPIAEERRSVVAR